MSEDTSASNSRHAVRVAQDAELGDLFDSFPAVLQLHLKRFEYDFERDIRVKVSTRYFCQSPT